MSLQHKIQDDTVKCSSHVSVCVFRAALFGRFRSWLGEVLGVELEPTVDISCARYEYSGEVLAGRTALFLGSFDQIFDD